MKRVVFSPQAKRDLQSIADYIAVDIAARAVTFIEEIEERCRKLEIFPFRRGNSRNWAPIHISFRTEIT